MYTPMVKVCGLTNTADALAALDYGADFLGFIVDVPVDTPRKITLTQADVIFSSLPEQASKVVVCMSDSVDKVGEIVSELNPNLLQLHGREPVELVGEIKREYGVGLIKVFHVDSNMEPDSIVNNITPYLPYIDYLLLDTFVKNKAGGTGLTHDWILSKVVKESVSKSLILSGGLNPGNVCEALKAVEPAVVDVASGVESAPGKKDHGKIKKFIEGVRECST